MRNEKITRVYANDKSRSLKLRELLQYKGLIWLFVKKNYSTRYKQTILGHLWILINPICTTVMNTVIFGGIAKLSTDGIPAPIFYLLGTMVWRLFGDNIGDNASTFNSNVGLFGKVYFPRLVVPISSLIVKMGDFLIQFGLLLVLTIVYSINGMHWGINRYVVLIPIVLIQLSVMGMSIGIIISSFTTKYRDLQVLVGFGVSIWMYLSPVVYSISEIPEKYLSLYFLNPVTPCMLIVKHAYTGTGFIPWGAWGVSILFTVVVAIIGILIFNKVERTFLDTV